MTETLQHMQTSTGEETKRKSRFQEIFDSVYDDPELDRLAEENNRILQEKYPHLNFTSTFNSCSSQSSAAEQLIKTELRVGSEMKTEFPQQTFDSLFLDMTQAMEQNPNQTLQGSSSANIESMDLSVDQLQWQYTLKLLSE